MSGDAEMIHLYGPGWRRVVAVLERASRITRDERTALLIAWQMPPADAYQAVLEAAIDAGLMGQMRAALKAAWRIGAPGGVTMAALAVVEHLPLDERHRRAMNRPWVRVLGKDWDR